LNQAFICTEGIIKDNFFDSIMQALANGKVVVFEQLPDKSQSIDTYVKVYNLNHPEEFLEDPHVFFESPLLLYTLYQLECKFGKKWVWIEQLLTNNPLFRSYKLTLKLIFKLSTYLHILAGERILFNYKQSLPHERITNLAFFPTENSTSKKRSTVGRKKKLKTNEKEEQNFSMFIDKVEKEKQRLPFQIIPDDEARLGAFFFNKVKYLAERKGEKARRFRPSFNRASSKPRDFKSEKYVDPFNIAESEKVKHTNYPNMPKYLGKSSTL
jgi:hypothetical protein